ncbi:acyltransferase-domain-containing protein [Kockovaella imperatae]|uniref:Acyltransferase-domain-containing protein n=1 Tax=Kockovaella imperatae TaxID=4999 RepID=A0A1Y1UR37_9TREE|nr:acyltransferase-domain-containing protein [Kockovaella imperatae]ORX39896.1 acyltransferase-domain-containing protein [Kockovaella imperatae]
MVSESQRPPLYTIPIDQRPPHGPLFSKVFFPLVFNVAQICINSTHFLALPLLLIPFGIGRRWFRNVIDYTKDGYGRLIILITVLFGPTTFVITSDAPVSNLVEHDDHGRLIRLVLPDRLVIVGNHQTYLDWMYIWILACYSGNASGIIILLKASLKKVPVVGWGMRFFRFIFLERSWAADKANLTRALQNLAKQARLNTPDETTGLVRSRREPLWLLIFPEGTITSDEERAKSVRYAKKEGVDDFKTLLHPRSTGLLFCLRTLLPEIPDLQMLDLTIGYPGVPYGKYPQEWYGLASTFFRSVPPPTVHIHMHLYSDLASPSGPIPSLHGESAEIPPSESRDFELWMRKLWTDKEKRMEGFYRDQHFEGSEALSVPVRQLKWYHNIAAFGAGGIVSVGAIAAVAYGIAKVVK